VKPAGLRRIAAPTLDGLSMDFNPRDLIANWVPSGPLEPGDPDSQLQSIYVPTKGRTQHVQDLLDSLRGSHAPVFLLPSCREDTPSGRTPPDPPVHHLCMQDDAECLSVLRSLRCTSNPVFATPETAWDLPMKRNYALWHARKNRFNQILLLDDDIRGLHDVALRAGARALRQWVLTGFFIDEFPDTSVIGHVELAVGERVVPFLSGSCLFVRSGAPIGFFPPIYNEDWIFMAPEIASGGVCSVGIITQEPYDPFSDLSLAAFQEPGEIIADGLFALLAAGYYADRFHQSSWNTVLSQRRDWLTSLAARAQDSQHRIAVEAARAVCQRITALDCASYVHDLEHDRRKWNQRLQELA